MLKRSSLDAFRFFVQVKSVQYNNDELLPDIILLLSQCYYNRGTRLNAMKRFCLCSLQSHLNVLTFSPLTGGCSDRDRRGPYITIKI